MGKFKNARITVIGLARSGVGVANLLSRLGAKVTVNDRKSAAELHGALASLDPTVSLHLGGHPPEIFSSSDFIVISPGVPIDSPFLAPARAKGVPVMGELEVAYQVLQEWLCGRPNILAVTGTNGKSTTTTLLYEMLRRGGFAVLLGGNIGTALSEVLCGIMQREGGHPPSALEDTIVAEISSFQLETVEQFRPKAAAILNITEDHLDRYASMDEYIEAKSRIFENQREGDCLILNADDPITAGLGQRLRHPDSPRQKGPDVFYFSRRNKVRGAFLDRGRIRFDLSGGVMSGSSEVTRGIPSEMTLDPSSFVIQGVHNIENAMAASLMAIFAGCSLDAVRATLEEFPGLEHRLEFVREIGGVKYINDSKGTNTGAVMKSLEGFAAPVILIAGGRDKHSDFTVLRPLVKEKVRALVLIGEATHAIRDALGDLVPTYAVGDDLSAAVRKAREVALPGDVVLLSPACASFDMFIDFEDRGRQFKKHVMDL